MSAVAQGSGCANRLAPPPIGSPEAAAGTGAVAPWAAALRARGSSMFAKLAWPHPKDEAWQHTSLKHVQNEAWQPAQVSPEALALLDAYLLAHPWNGSRVVFLDGVLARMHMRAQDADALQAVPLSKAVTCDATARPGVLSADAEQPFAALNSAWLGNGVVLTVAEGKTLSAPLQLLFVTLPRDSHRAGHPRVVIDCGAASHAAVFEQHVHATQAAENDTCCGRHLLNLVTECHVARQASLDYTILQDGHDTTMQFSQWMAKIADDGEARGNVINLGASLARQEMHVQLGGVRAAAYLTGLNLASGHQHMDTQVTVDHQSTEGKSSQLFKSLLDDHATSVFCGRVLVQPHAQKTAARQMSRNVLLSKTATAYTRPQLEILADDVRCTHGATVGQLQDEAVFYLRSRGLDEATTRKLLTYAQAAEVLNDIRHPFIHALCDARVRLELALEAGASTLGDKR